MKALLPDVLFINYITAFRPVGNLVPQRDLTPSAPGPQPIKRFDIALKTSYKLNREGGAEKGGFMATYVILSTLTDEGRRTIKQKPERIQEVNKELEKMGVKVREQYAVLGPYDFVNIVEAPDNKAVMRMSVELGSRGSVHLLTLAALPVGEFIKNLK
jgi:uncharacterized protein with GYD domain